MKVICVDDEYPILENFKRKAQDLPEIESLHLFQSAGKAIEWMENNAVDIAFLDIEMPCMNGIELAKKLKQKDRNIRIIYVTAYEEYALDAFRVDALGYLLKPYTRDEIQHELGKAILMRAKPKKRVVIQTIPGLVVKVDGKVLHFDRTKPEELLALLVDRAEAGVTMGEAIACLWPGRPADESTKTLYRVTFHRLIEVLKKEGIEDIISAEGRKKYIVTEQVECDLYCILEGDREVIQKYNGEYLKDYSWAEFRNAQLNSIREKVYNII